MLKQPRFWVDSHWYVNNRCMSKDLCWICLFNAHLKSILPIYQEIQRSILMMAMCHHESLSLHQILALIPGLLELFLLKSWYLMSEWLALFSIVKLRCGQGWILQRMLVNDRESLDMKSPIESSDFASSTNWSVIFEYLIRKKRIWDQIFEGKCCHYAWPVFHHSCHWDEHTLKV